MRNYFFVFIYCDSTECPRENVATLWCETIAVFLYGGFFTYKMFLSAGKNVL